MKYKVIRRFRDKNTQERYAVGDEYETNNWRRGKSLQEMGFLGEKIEEPKKGNRKKKSEDK
jgi:hypothetical protein